MKALRLLTAVGALVLAISIVAEASHTPRHRWEGASEAQRSAALERAEQHGMFAKIQMDAGGNVTGRFVSFHYAKAAGTSHNFTVKSNQGSALLFDAITPTPFTLTEEPFVLGNVFRSPTAGLGIAVHNNPVALSQWAVPQNATQAVTVTFDLASGVTVKSLNTTSARLDRGAGHIHLVSKGNVTLTNSTEGVTATIPPGERLLFMAHPPGGHMAAFLHVLNNMYERGILGGVYWMVGVEGTAMFDGLETDVVVNVKTIRKGHITIEADSNATGGRVFVFVVDPDTLSPQRADKIKATLNGAAVAEASGEADVANGTQAKVRVMRGQEVAVIFVKVPHFSTQTIVLEEEEAAADGDGTGGATGDRTPALGAISVTLSVLAAAFILTRRRQR